jgi:hypothetical protein
VQSCAGRKRGRNGINTSDISGLLLVLEKEFQKLDSKATRWNLRAMACTWRQVSAPLQGVKPTGADCDQNLPSEKSAAKKAAARKKKSAL